MRRFAARLGLDRAGRRLARLARSAGRFLAARVISLGLLAVLIWVQLFDPKPVEVVRTRVFDLYQNLRPRPVLENSPVVVADIDERSLAAYGQWPWPRTLVAQLVAALNASGARAVGFDVVFAEGDRTSPEYASRFMAGLDDATFEKLGKLPRNDAILAEQMRAAAVVLGQPVVEAALETERAPLAPSVNTIGDVRRFVPAFPALLRNIGELEAAASGRGVFSLLAESDGIVRRVPSVLRVEDAIHPTLALELLRVALGRRSIDVRAGEFGIDALRLSPFVVPTDEKGRIWVYYSPRETLRDRTHSVLDILSGATPREQLHRRIVLVGTSAAGLLDLRSTPLESTVPGVEIHAQLLDMILAENYLLRPNWTAAVEVLATLLAGTLVALLVPTLGALAALIAGVLVVAAVAGGSWWGFVGHGLLLDASYPTVATGLLFVVIVFQGYFREEVEKRRIRNAFGQYLSPALVEQLADDPAQLRLGGETKDMTMLFCDVRGFTTISERYKADPTGLTTLINRLLTPLSNAILEHGGTIDKYMGDCVMAFWNAPLADAEHPIRACRAALALHDALAELNARRAAEAAETGADHIPLRVGAGINSGSVVVGNMGSSMRFDYSVLGDAVNLASRLEGQSKLYGVDTILGEDTVRSLDRRFAVLELDRIVVQGKTRGVRIFALLGDSQFAASPLFEALEARQGELLAAYRSRQWNRAERFARELRDRQDAPSAYYDMMLERIASYRQQPPPPDWNGDYEAATK